MTATSPNIKRIFRETFILWKRTFYKTLEFQFLFKTLYILIFFWITSFVISRVIGTITFASDQIARGISIENISLLSMINEVKLIISAIITFFIIFSIYHIEKNGVMIITTEYYRNNFISFFKTLFIAITRTPCFFLHRILELRIVIIIFIALYFLQRFFIENSSNADAPTSLLIVIYGVFLYILIFLRHSFTSHIIYLAPQESPHEFNKKIPRSFLFQRLQLMSIFYITISISILTWLFILFLATYILIMSGLYIFGPTSYIMTIFISWAVVSTAVIFSLFTSFRSCLMSVLYYDQRRAQEKKITFLPEKNRPLHSKKYHYGLLFIFIPIVIGSIFLATSIKSQADTILTSDHESINDASVKKIDLNFFDNISVTQIKEDILSPEKNIVKKSEKYILLYLTYITQKK
jgi:hypothetical protein